MEQILGQVHCMMAPLLCGNTAPPVAAHNNGRSLSPFPQTQAQPSSTGCFYHMVSQGAGLRSPLRLNWGRIYFQVHSWGYWKDSMWTEGPSSPLLSSLGPKPQEPPLRAAPNRAAAPQSQGSERGKEKERRERGGKRELRRSEKMSAMVTNK